MMGDDSKGGEQALPQRVQDLIAAAMEIEADDVRNGHLGYMARALVQATLPHSDPKLPYFTRSNYGGKLKFNIIAPPDIGIPFGSTPRVLLAWLQQQAVKTQSPEISLGRSQNEFLEKLGMHKNGRDASRIKDQSRRLFTSMISITGEKSHEFGFKNIQIADEGMLLWNPRKPDEPTLWDSTIRLSTPFFTEVTEHAVPIDMRVLDHLRRSPLAIDIYVWLVYRLFQPLPRPMLIPWEALKAQLGADYSDDAKGIFNFKSKFQQRLKEVLVFYPQANVHPTKEGLMLRTSPPHILPSSRTKLPVKKPVG